MKDSLRLPATQSSNTLAQRITIVAGLVVLLGIVGLIALAVSGDDSFGLFGFRGGVYHAPTEANVGIQRQGRSYDAAPTQLFGYQEDADIQYRDPIFLRRAPAGGRSDSDKKGDAGRKDGYRDEDKKSADGKGPGRHDDFAAKDKAPPREDFKKDGGSYGGPKDDAKKPAPDEMPKDKDGAHPKSEEPRDKESPTGIQTPIETNRKIIRTGEMDFEIDSYDVAVVNITKLVVQTKGAFISDSKSGQLKNGKVHGYVVVRMAPQFLDQFILDLRRDLGKTGELKTQRIHSQDVTKQYTDVESGLKAARTMEGRFLEIIKTGKGQIKDLIAAENALGEWRTKIEKLEGEMRYYANQISLSTLTISLSERELQTPFAMIASETVNLRIEVEDVKAAHRNAEKAVLDAKGRVVRSEVTQHAAGHLEAILHAEIPPPAKESFGTLIEKLGIVSQQESHRQSEARGGVGRPAAAVKAKESDVRFEVKFNNLVAIAARKSATVQVAAKDVPVGYRKLHDAITRVKGQVRTTNLNETDRKNVTASIEFSVPTTDKQVIDKALEEIGPLLSRNNLQKENTELASERKFGYSVTLISVTNIQPREKTQLKIEVKNVDESVIKLKEITAAAQGRILEARTQRRPNGEVAAILEFDVPFAARDSLVRQFKDLGKLIGQEEERFPHAPDNEHAIARIHVILAGESPIVPSDEGFGNSIRSSLYLSYKIFMTCLMLIIIGVSAVGPWALVGWGGYKLYCRLTGAPAPVAVTAPVTVQPAENERPVPNP